MHSYEQNNKNISDWQRKPKKVSKKNETWKNFNCKILTF